MEEKKKIKLKIGTIFAIIEFILILVFAGIIWYASTKYEIKIKGNNETLEKETNTTNNTINTVTNNTTQSATVKNEIKKIDNSKELVYAETKSFTNSDVNETYKSNLPIINLDYENVKKVNQEIQAYYEENRDGGKFDYDSYLNDNILSVVIEDESYFAEWVSYTTYNIDIYTGKILNNIELLYYKDFLTADINTKIEQVIANKFIKDYNLAANYIFNYAEGQTDTEKEINDLYYKSLGWNSINSQMFLDDNGNINIIADIASMAGAESYYHIVNLGI